MGLIHELGRAVVEGVRDWVEEGDSAVVPRLDVIDRHTLKITYVDPVAPNPKGKVVIIQHGDFSGETDWPAAPDVQWNSLSGRVIVRPGIKGNETSRISEVRASGDHKVLITGLELDRVKAKGKAKIIIRSYSSPREVIVRNRGRVKLLSPRQ